MLNFLIFIFVFAISAFLLAFSIRYGMTGANRMEAWLSEKSGRNFEGYDWYYRIPFSIGLIPEYFFALVLTKDNYFKTNWWSLKTSSFISVLLFLAVLKSRSSVSAYYSLTLLQNQGFAAYLTSGAFVWFLNFITLMYVALGVLLIMESIKAAGWYAPVRFLYYGLLCLLMASLTLSVLSGILALALVYFIYKIVSFLFFKSSNRRKQEEEETAGTILSKGLGEFKEELSEWESERKTISSIRKPKNVKPHHKPVIRRKKPVKPIIEKPEPEDEIPRLFPD
ncbi:MAG: hypothetical protein JXR71_01430 [Bacteroidales bacterium]|nr:hypothetical protein [Bacteroidales bacterium]